MFSSLISCDFESVVLKIEDFNLTLENIPIKEQGEYLYSNLKIITLNHQIWRIEYV